jgi:hypothetical protein
MMELFEISFANTLPDEKDTRAVPVARGRKLTLWQIAQS